MIGLMDRLPPQNLEAEQGVLGSMVLDASVIAEVVASLSADDFYRSAHQLIYRAVCDLWSTGGQVDALILVEELTRRGQLADVGGEDAVVEIVNSVPHTLNGREYAAIVKQKSIARQLIEAATATIREAYSNQFTGEQLLDNAQKSILEITDRVANAKADLKTMGQAMDRAMDVIDARRHGSVVGVASGLTALDAMLTFSPGSLTVIGGRPGTGKSALALGIVTHAAIKLGVPVLVLSMEMVDAEIGERAFSQLGCASGFHMRHPRDLDDDEFARLMGQIDRGREIGKNAPIYIDDTSGRTSMQIISIARRARLRQQIGLVVVDYLQLCEADDERDNRQEQVSKISRRLKVLARTLDVPVIALSQLNRQCESRDDRRPRKSDLRESGSLEQDADNVLLMFAPEDRPEEAEIIIDKSRSGPTGPIRVTFHRNLMRFETYVPPIPDAAVF